MPGRQEQEEQVSAWSEGYGGFRGDDEYVSGGERGREQKLDVDSDEIFADMLIKRMRQEGRVNDSQIRVEMAKMNMMRMWVGIVSVFAVVMLFGILGFVSTMGISANAGIGLGWGFVAACAVLFAVNGYINWASIEMSKQMYGSKEGEGKKDVK